MGSQLVLTPIRKLVRAVKSASTRLRHKIFVDPSLARSGKYWDSAVADEADSIYWLALPEVVSWVNRKVSGKPAIWHLSWFLLSLEDKTPVKRALSIGCGAGNLEREVIRHGSAVHIEGIDVSSGSLEKAKALAAEAGYAERISYHLADALSYLQKAAGGAGYDLIFLHASLHHIERLEEVLELAATCLKGSPGLLYLDEYVGPSRNEWSDADLGYASSLYGRIPLALRRTRELKAPIAFDDPTEMIRSSEIPTVLREYFDVVEYKPYFGNVVMPLVSGIPRRSVTDPLVASVIDNAMQLEDFLISRKLIDPIYAVFVGRPKS
ncbi:MAG: methyltransferase domain-containing protein [Acidobacteria bacterium]|nr:MAG: methyltransferase domain-containing protein [Acidobacteriota bacterium]